MFGPLSASGATVQAAGGARVNTGDVWWRLRVMYTQDVLPARAEAPDAAALERLMAHRRAAAESWLMHGETLGRGGADNERNADSRCLPPSARDPDDRSCGQYR